jgi:hypothetical protein
MSQFSLVNSSKHLHKCLCHKISSIKPYHTPLNEAFGRTRAYLGLSYAPLSSADREKTIVACSNLAMQQCYIAAKAAISQHFKLNNVSQSNNNFFKFGHKHLHN